MKTISIRDLRQRWPEAEAALKIEEEIIITRDSKPVAKLVLVDPVVDKRQRWNSEEHKKWIRKVYGSKMFPSTDDQLTAARSDRDLI